MLDNLCNKWTWNKKGQFIYSSITRKIYYEYLDTGLSDILFLLQRKCMENIMANNVILQ